MTDFAYLIIHKDHPVDLHGVNSGAETATLWLARTLASLGRRVVVAAQLVRGEETQDGVEYWDLGSGFDVVGTLHRARAIGPYRLIAACRATALLAAKHEPGCVGRYFIAHDPSGGATGIKTSLLPEIADGIICVSEAQKALFVEQGIPSEFITVIPNGADRGVFAPTRFEQRDPKRIVFAGALVADKGIDILIRAFALVRRAIPDATLDVYGSGAMWGRAEPFDLREVERQVPGVRFHGSVSQREIAAAFGAASVAVIPSRWFDSFPLTAVEAQSTGCPVIAFQVGGIAEALVDGVTGTLVPEVGEEPLAHALIEHLRDPRRIERMSEAASRLVAEKFSWKHVARRVIELCESSRTERSYRRKGLGLVSRWNQRCGIATYAQFLFSEFEQSDLTIFSEITPTELTDKDADNVIRCWKRESDDFSALIRAVKESDVGLLHVNVHSIRFFPSDAFAEALLSLKQSGILIVLHVHSTFTSDPHWRKLCGAADRIIVHADQNKLQLIAEGVRDDAIVVLPHGVRRLSPLTGAERVVLRSELGLPVQRKIIVAFGFVQPHKGMEGVIESVLHLQRLGIDAQGVIVGAPSPDDANSLAYQRALEDLAQSNNIGDRITFVKRFVDDDEVTKYLQAADLVLMNYRSQHFEASGACALAVGAGAVVATSLAPQFTAFKDAVWQITSGFSVTRSVELLLTNDDLRQSLQRNAVKYASTHEWRVVARDLGEFYRRELGFVPQRCERSAVVAQPTVRGPLRVLIQNRPNTFTNRGGDTIVLEHTADGLKRLGVQVHIDVEGTADPAKYDIVHLFNFALPDLTRTFAERAYRAGVPYVVTTLYEDVPSFHQQSHLSAACLAEYVRRGQDPQFWQMVKDHWKTASPCQHFDNAWTAKHAAALLSNGSVESRTIRRDFTECGPIVEVPLGCEVGAKGDRSLFKRTYGVRDFVFCVGRLESRKNQLMLLKALEDEDVAVVFAAGGFTYQEDYAAAVRAFRRRGKTLVLDRLSPEMLASAYAAARVHALPSWYELPGLVSIEAAVHGCAVVATDCGTARDYLGSFAEYCHPGDERSVREAVLRGLQKGGSAEFAAHAARYRWADIGASTFKVYTDVLGRTGDKHMSEATMTTSTIATTAASPAFGAFDLSTEVTEFQDVLERGELAAKNGDLATAHELLAKAEALNPASVRALKARGAILLAESKTAEARAYFERAWAIDSHDPRVLCGLGMCELRADRAINAYRYFTDALAVAPDSQVAILQLIPCAYALGRFDDLERALRSYTQNNPEDLDMLYCFGGCLFKMGRFNEAEAVAEQLIAKNSGDTRAIELRDLARGKMATQPTASQVEAAPTTIPVTPTVAAGAATAAQPVPQPSMNSLTAKADAALSKLTKNRSASQLVVEKISEPTPAPASSHERSAESVQIDMEIGKLEDAKRNKQLDVVRRGCADLRSRTLSAEQREIVVSLEAEVSILEGDIAAGQRMYEEILDRNPASVRALSGKGVVAAHENRWDEARSYFERANSYKPNNDVALAGLALCAWQAGQTELAFSRFQQALTANPENNRALLGLMQVGYPLQRYSEVEEAIKAYLELHPADLEWVYCLAGCYFAQNKLEEAMEAVQQITLFKPSDERANELRGMIAERQHATS